MANPIARDPFFDDEGRIWARRRSSALDAGGRSRVDLYRVNSDELRFVGMVDLQDRVVGIDVLGTTLVALSMRDHDDPLGVSPRRLDWYDISELPTALNGTPP